MKKILPLLLMISSPLVFAQNTGQFEISQTGFKELFNKHRYASPEMIPWASNFFPYSDYGTAVKLDKVTGDPSSRGVSPMGSYALLPGGSDEAEGWEREVHGCDGYDAKTKKACRAWWGHCNGWAAAAIKEKEPRQPRRFKGVEYSVADQKGMLAELWLSNYSTNAGLSDKNIKTGKWVNNHRSPTESYNMFWDVTPKAFFLLFTNYIGVMKTGLVVDRFTGDEVWNQPVVGYRLLPIDKDQIQEVQEGQKKYWSVRLAVKFYWANDIGLRHDHVSKPFDISKMNDTENIETLTEDYEGRFLAFRLNFDSKVTVSPDGKRVLTAGRMVGDGIWEHQEESEHYSFDDLNNTHPDFIWLPTQAVQDTSGYGNPHIDGSVVAAMLEGKEIPNSRKDPLILKLSFAPRYLEGSDTTPEIAKRIVQSVIRREGIKHSIFLRDIEITRNRVSLLVKFPEGVDENNLSDLFDAAEMPVKIEK
jgi:hypothetical protein